MRYSRLWLLPCLAVLLTIGSFAAPPRQVGAADDLCFAQTGKCINSRFRDYWERNGGLPVFGYPISEAADELNRDTGRMHLTQWFERARLEYHEENPPSARILLGRLGAEVLDSRPSLPMVPLPIEPLPGCLWFKETGHNVCNQASGRGFMSYWQTHGLREPGQSRYAQSLALFGYPLTEARQETNSSGDTVLTQWFERARLEWHPNNPDQFKVLQGLLGKEFTAPKDLSFNQRWQEWTSKQILNYDFVVEVSCFCPPDYNLPVLIKVRNGQAISMSKAADGAPLDEGVRKSYTRFDTIEKIFAFVANALKQNAYKAEITYNPALGYPTKIWIDYDQRIADEEQHLTIHRLDIVK